MMGGSETYGRFIERPFATLVEEQINQQIVNLGSVNAGVDAYARDPAILNICAGAKASVLQITGAQNMSNRLYIVHPRRNDRFLRASPLLKNLFRDVDFTEFNFTRHMLNTLQEVSPERFTLVIEELRAAWLARMRFVAESLPGAKILLHAGREPLPKVLPEQGMGSDPLFIDQGLVAQLKPCFTDLVQVVASEEARTQGADSLCYGPLEEGAAKHTLGPKFHAEVARALAPKLQALMA
ncbi:hypothetical protein ATO10_07212 [Actibacterium atlanticum]|uniref:DUF6473 domain-containing protein n=2 Tax=Actibacterium atlanticum TaxID=1461693 RepID=A0A058ZKK6_9RHOB|nr:hypothetical protein ATO10_07212 [Actibacterium atlanticum]